MNEAQQIQDQVHAAWQVCQKNSGTDGNHLPTYPTESPALEVEGRDVAGWIALPRFDEFHKLNGITFVHQARNASVFLGTTNKNGDYHQINTTKPAQNKTIYLGNCHKQATVIAEITNCTVIVVPEIETAHMVRRLAEDGLFPKNIIIFSNSKNLKHTQLISEQRGCGWVQIASLENQEETRKIGFDTYSFIRENTETALQIPKFNEEKKPPLSFTQHSLSSRDQHSWIVQDIIAKKSLNAIYGVSASGKTFVALDLSAAISTGRKWLGKKTNKCPVLYLALESPDGFILRMKAYKLLNGAASLSSVHAWFNRFSFSNLSDISQLIDHINGGGFNGGIIFIDTLARAMSGWDENSATDMGKMIEACGMITERTNCAIVLVAHAGKNQQAGLRGHSSLHGAVDSSIEVRSSGKERKLVFDKIKEGSDGMEYPFTLNIVTLGTSEDGQPITSCCVEYL